MIASENTTAYILNKDRVVAKKPTAYTIVPSIIQFIVITISKILFKILFRYEVSGLENVKNLPKGVIFAANHTSELDPVVVPVSLPYLSHHVPMFYVSREKSFYIKSGWRKAIYGGSFFKACGAYPVYVGRHNYEESLKNHIKILEDNQSVCIFPEGKRSFDGKIGEAKGGVGYLVCRTRKPVIPVAISGLTNLNLKDVVLRKTKLRVTFGKPLLPSELFEDLNNVSFVHEHDDCKIAARKIMETIIAIKN